ncbi:hypothetical protein C1N51_27990 (plasmid) [Vibrio campbellii]|nr:hypothetical protein C1N51_27990 [Vibrio campbellii]
MLNANINVYGYLGLMPKNESKIAQTNTNNSDTIKRSKLAKCFVKLSMKVIRMQAPSEQAMRTLQMNLKQRRSFVVNLSSVDVITLK